MTQHLLYGDLSAGKLPIVNTQNTLTTLANAAGYLHNDGAGALAYVAPALSFLGNASGQYHIPVSGGSPFAYAESGFLIDGTTGGKTILAVTSGKTLTLTATDNVNLTVPTTGTAALLGIANVFSAIQTIGSVAGDQLIWGSYPVSFPGYMGVLGFGSYNSGLLPYIGRNIVGGAGSTYTIINSAPGTYGGLEFNDSTIRFFYGSGTTGATVTPSTALSIRLSDGYTIAPNLQIGLNAPQSSSGFTLEDIGTPYSGAIRFGSNSGWKFIVGRYAESAGGSHNTGATGAIVAIGDDGRVGIGTTLVDTSHATYAKFNIQDGSLLFTGQSGSSFERALASIVPAYVVNTDASRTTRTIFNAYDTVAREALRIEASGTAAMIGFLGANAVARQTGDIIAGLNNLGLFSGASLKLSGIHASTPITYISGTGTAGVDNTAQTVKSLTLPANALTQVGDRMRIRAYWTGDTGSPVTGSVKIGPSGSEVLVSDTTDGGAATLQLNEVWIHYIDNTHANIIENEAGALGANSAPNVVGFTWNAAQAIIFTQDAISNNHTILYALIVDVFPKGV